MRLSLLVAAMDVASLVPARYEAYRPLLVDARERRGGMTESS